jgi:leucyl-tRNA synthetase
MIKESSIEIPIQINGKLKGRITVSADASEDEVKKAVNSYEKISTYLKDKQVVKFIYVKNKIVTIVVK